MAKNRFSLAWDILTNPNRNLFNEAIYKLVGGIMNTYNEDLETLLVYSYRKNSDVNIINQQASKTSIVPYCVKLIENDKAHKKLKRFPINPTYLQKKIIKKLQTKAYDTDTELPFPLEAKSKSNMGRNMATL